MAKLFENSDLAGIIMVLVGIFALAFAANSKAVPGEWLWLGGMILAFFALGRPLAPVLWRAFIQQQQHEGPAEYWAEIVKYQTKSFIKNRFSFMNLNLPESYMPTLFKDIETKSLMLFEINATDLSRYKEIDLDNYPMGIFLPMTIIYSYKRKTVRDIRQESLKTVYNDILEHPDNYETENELLLPETIETNTIHYGTQKVKKQPEQQTTK